MKKFKLCLTALALMAALSLSASAEPIFGLIYKGASTPGAGYTSIPVSKTGSSTCTSVFGLVAFGDCSVRTAMRNGKITQLAFYDTYTKNILGFIEMTTKAYGK